MHASATGLRMSPALIVGVLALLLGLQPVTTDLYLPALPVLARELGAPMTRGAADDVGADPGLRHRAVVLGPGGRPRRPPPGAARRAAAVHRGQRRRALAPAASMRWWCGARCRASAWRAAVVCARAMVRDLYETARRRAVMSLGAVGPGRDRARRPADRRRDRQPLGWRSALLAHRRVRRRRRWRSWRCACPRRRAALEPAGATQLARCWPTGGASPATRASSPGRCW